MAALIAAGTIAVACETPRPVVPSDFETNAGPMDPRDAVPPETRDIILRRMHAITDRMAAQESRELRPWVEANARALFPSILEPSGPSMNAFLIHDSQLRVYRSSLMTMYYLNGKRPDADIDADVLKEVEPSFVPGQDGWGVVDPRGLRGLVRDNVRVIRIHHDPGPEDMAPLEGLSQGEMARRTEQARRLARQYHPEMFGRSGTQIAIALVLDSHERVIAHAAATDENRNAKGRYRSGEDCVAVLTRLLPQYKTAQWSQTGCAGDSQPNVIVYWGRLLKP